MNEFFEEPGSGGFVDADAGIHDAQAEIGEGFVCRLKIGAQDDAAGGGEFHCVGEKV